MSVLSVTISLKYNFINQLKGWSQKKKKAPDTFEFSLFCFSTCSNKQ